MISWESVIIANNDTEPERLGIGEYNTNNEIKR